MAGPLYSQVSLHVAKLLHITPQVPLFHSLHRHAE